MTAAERPAPPARRLWISAAAVLGSALVRLLGLTWRVRREGVDQLKAARAAGHAVAIALWHGELLPLLWCHRGQGIAPLISSHADGEVIARIVTSLGFRPIRGSTSRGGARALMEAVGVLREGRDVAFTTDGPRGPRRVSAPGIGVAAAKAGAVVVPVGATVSRAWVVRSWDRFVVPKPFATIVYRYGAIISPAGSRVLDGEAVVPEIDRVLLGVSAPDPA
jgi:lysophospholipid acyltransferase (LPLAT)-like uncharacterized protein